MCPSVLLAHGHRHAHVGRPCCFCAAAVPSRSFGRPQGPRAVLPLRGSLQTGVQQFPQWGEHALPHTPAVCETVPGIALGLTPKAQILSGQRWLCLALRPHEGDAELGLGPPAPRPEATSHGCRQVARGGRTTRDPQRKWAVAESSAAVCRRDRSLHCYLSGLNPSSGSCAKSKSGHLGSRMPPASQHCVHAFPTTPQTPARA